MTPALPPPFSLQNAWSHVGDLYEWIVSLFGAPRAIADQRLLLRKKRQDILSWLGPAEALARRLLLLKALTLPPQNCPPAPALKGKLVIAFADRATPEMQEDAANWRVRFCVWPYGATRKASKPMPPGAQRDGAVCENALPLARRLEALNRVLENPAPAVMRLARLLAARRQMAPRAFAPYRPPAGPIAAALYEAQEALDAALNTS